MKQDAIDQVITAVGAIIAFIICVFIAWATLASMVWAVTSPIDNRTRCEAIATSKGVEFSTTGWRNDTCYLYSKGGKEEVIKL